MSGDFSIAIGIRSVAAKDSSMVINLFDGNFLDDDLSSPNEGQFFS